MTRAEALDKIRKLLRMQRGGTAGEVENALAAAQRLAAEHGIDLNSVDPDQAEQRRISHDEIHTGVRIQCECKYAALIIQRFFHVSTFIDCDANRRRLVVIVGTDWDREIAIYVYRFLVAHFRREWNHRTGRIRNRQAFMWGMYKGLWRKLVEQEPEHEQKPGLILSERGLALRNAYIAAHFGALSSKSMRPDHNADKAAWQGYLAGQNTNIRKGMYDADERPQIPLSRALAAPS